MLNIEHLAARVGQLRDDGAARATHSVSRWRWRSGCRAGDATGCRADGCGGPAARRGPNRRAGSPTDKATDRSLVEVVWIVHADKSSASANAIPPGARNAFAMS